MALSTVVFVLGLAFAFAVLYRRYQITAARRARLDGLAASILAAGEGQPNRQQLADVLKDWESLSVARSTDLTRHLAKHPRPENVDLSDPAARLTAYQALVGTSPGKSPEK